MRPDILVKLPPDKVLLIDAKVPMQNYLSAMQQDVTDEDKNIFLTKHALDFKNHIKALSSKDYTQGFNSFDWVVMFLPLEGLVQMAMDKEANLVEFAWQKNVIIATPTNLLGLMRTVSYAHDQFKVNENAREIARMGEELYGRIMTFAAHFSKMGRGLGTALDSYNDAVASLERNVMSSLRRMKEIGVGKNDAKDKLPIPIDHIPRQMTVDVDTADLKQIREA
jgi:DNA recombination protein RmuC